MLFFFLMIRRPPRSTLDRSSAASDVYKRQPFTYIMNNFLKVPKVIETPKEDDWDEVNIGVLRGLSLIHISEPTRPY